MATDGDIFEVLNLNDSSDDEFGFNYVPLIERDLEEDGDDEVRVQETNLNPLLFVPSKYYCFKRELAEYLIHCLEDGVKATPETIVMLDSNFLHQGDTPLNVFHQAVLKKWRHYEKSFGVQTNENGERRLFNKVEKYTHLFIPYIDEWTSIIKSAHLLENIHQSLKKTMSNIANQGWLVGAHLNGMPRLYIEEVIKECSSCDYGQKRSERVISVNTRSRGYREYNEHYTIPIGEKENFIQDIKAKHVVHLKLIQVYKKVRPYAAKVSIYVCHRGREFRGKKIDQNDSSESLRLRSSAKYVGCTFRLKIVEPEQEGQVIEMYVNSAHSGHVPGSKTDCYFLPVHQSAIHNCAEMLRNLNNIPFTLAYSKKCEEILRKKAPVHEQETFRFFLDPKEASNLSYRLQLNERCGEDDWETVKEMVPKWIEKKMCIFYQPYSLEHPVYEKRPFVLVMQTPDMLERAKTITEGASWAIDSTFKTNQWGMPLYAGVCPNTSGLGMPIFLMLCSADKDSGQEGTALWLTMRVVFKNMGAIRPNAIVIDKSKTELNAISKAINEDVWCWKNGEIGGTQTKCILLLCWFHAKKAWVEALLSKLDETRRNDLYQAMCSMLESITEEQFNDTYSKFKITYANDKKVLKYVEKGWAGENSPWKRMWPRFSRMFKHAHVNTTNLAERMWQYIKYTLLNGKVNRRLDELIIALIGHPETGRRFGGSTLIEYYDDAHWLSESRKYSLRGGDRSRNAKLQRARKLVQRYKLDPTSNLEVLDECCMEFSIRSQTHSSKWYTVSLSREWCECDDYGPICKHMWAVKMIVNEQFQHLQDLLPSMYEPLGFINRFDEQTTEDISLAEIQESVDVGTSGRLEDENVVVEGDSLMQKFISDFLGTTSNLMTTERMEALTLDQYETIRDAGQSFLAVLEGAMGLEPRPSQIPMPRAGSSITQVQFHVTNTRLGHGNQRKKRKLTSNDEVLDDEEESTPGSRRPTGTQELRRTQRVQKKRTRVKLPKLLKEACPECADLNIFFDDVTTTECRNCQCLIVRGVVTTAKENDGPIVDQDLEQFFEELGIN